MVFIFPHSIEANNTQQIYNFLIDAEDHEPEEEIWSDESEMEHESDEELYGAEEKSQNMFLDAEADDSEKESDD